MKKSMAAMILGMGLGFSTTAMAAAADSFTDVPKDHWSYQALDVLAKDGIIEGYTDGTFQGNRAMSRYEMAVIIAKAMGKTGSISDQAILEKLEREYGSELSALDQKIDAVDKKVDATNARIDNVKITGFVRTQWDSDKTDDAAASTSTNNNDNKRFYMDLEGEMKVAENWKAKFQSETNRHYSHNDATGKTHKGQDGTDTGTFQRIWVDGTLANNWYVNIGRKWSGIGYQNMLQGSETDGIQFWHPMTKDIMVSGWYFAPTWDGADYDLYGVNFFGKVAKNLEMNVAYGQANKEKWFGDKYAAVDLRTQVLKNVKLTGTYVWTGANKDNTDKAVRIDYKDTNLKNVGSFGAYARYVNYGANGDVGHDDEWGSLPSNMKGWILGLKYVPWQNVEWQTLYSKQKVNVNSTNDNRKLFRTELDFHF